MKASAAAANCTDIPARAFAEGRGGTPAIAGNMMADAVARVEAVASYRANVAAQKAHAVPEGKAIDLIG